MANAANKTKAKYVAQIDAIELAIRIREATAGGPKRPAGVTEHQVFFQMDKQDQDVWLSAANAAMAYWRECIDNMQRPS